MEGGVTEEELLNFIHDNELSDAQVNKLVDFLTKDYLTYKDYSNIPVGPREFIESSRYMNAKGIFYPKILDEFEAMHSGEFIEAVLTGAIGVGKRLTIGTPIPTPNGFVPMGELKDGDKVLGADGNPYDVIKAHDIELSKDAYTIEFSDGVSIVADGEHNWWAASHNDRSRYLSGNTKEQYKIYTTLDMYNELPARFSVPMTKPVAGNHFDFTTDPYLLGYWLGAGDAALARVSSGDEETLDEYRKLYRASYCRGYGYNITGGFLEALQHNGLIGNKRVPDGWLTATLEQRIAVVQGFMDAEGNIVGTIGSVSFIQKSVNVTNGIITLLRSLGCKPIRSKITKWFNGVPLEYTSVSFVPPLGIDAFRLRRKKRLVIREEPQSHSLQNRYISDIKKAPDCKMRCITVGSADGLYLCGEGYTVTHNTHIALYGIAYSVYLLSCLKSPHRTYRLDPSSEIVFIIQSKNANLAKTVDYRRLRHMIEKAPYFRDNFKFEKSIESAMLFPTRIGVVPVSGSESAALGNNVIGGLIDEMNFMDVIENSKGNKDGGTYDQAVALYDSLSKRRKSRFLSQGKLPGMLYLVSSKRYPGQFTDQKMDEAKEDIERHGKTSIYVYDYRTWDVVPPDRFIGEWFKVFIGDDTRDPRVLDDDISIPEGDANLVVEVPGGYRVDFDRNIMSALRDIAGVSTLTKHPFILDRASVSECFGVKESLLSHESIVFGRDKLKVIKANAMDQAEPRWVHVDLAVTRDALGISMGYVKKFVTIKVGKDEVELMPEVHFDFMLQVKPPNNGEIEFAKIRSLIYTLRNIGLDIRWVSFDSYQSRDSMQILYRKGFDVGVVSMDTDISHYLATKHALQERRIVAPKHDVVQGELRALEYDPKKDKVDHRGNSTKDVSDSMAGVVGGLMSRMEVWLRHNIAPHQVPDHVKKLSVDTRKDKDEY